MASNLTNVIVLFTSLQNIVILSIIVTVYVPVSKAQNMHKMFVRSHNGTLRPLYLCDFLENRFSGHSSQTA